MARKIKKLTLTEIRKKKKDIVKNIHSLLSELERASVDGRNLDFYDEWPEEDWIDETFFEANGVFDKLDDLTDKIYKYR